MILLSVILLNNSMGVHFYILAGELPFSSDQS